VPLQPNRVGEDAPYEPDTWTNAAFVSVTLSAQDNEGGSGLKEIRFSGDDFSERVYQLQSILGFGNEGIQTIRYYATDNAGNQESPKTLTTKIDKTSPIVGSVTINGGDAFTNKTAVNLTLSSYDQGWEPSGVAEMRFSEDGTTWSAWEPFATSKEWVVSNGDGEKSVYVQFKDAAGNESDAAQDIIVLDKTPPKVSSTSPSNNATGVAATATISAIFLESGSGIAPGTLTTDTFKVVQVKASGDVPVSGTVSYSESTKTATFSPSSKLAKGAYQATIATGVKDQADNALTNAYTWTFATAGPSKR